LSESTDDATATKALREAQALMPRARGNEVIGLTLVQANAYGMQGDTARGCPLVRRTAERAKGTTYERQFALLMESC
jgi:hypothetical protein